jgi:hypothetical protein
MTCETPEVRALLPVLTDKVQKIREPLDAQAVGNSLFGLQVGI